MEPLTPTPHSPPRGKRNDFLDILYENRNLTIVMFSEVRFRKRALESLGKLAAGKLAAETSGLTDRSSTRHQVQHQHQAGDAARAAGVDGEDMLWSSLQEIHEKDPVLNDSPSRARTDVHGMSGVDGSHSISASASASNLDAYVDPVYEPCIEDYTVGEHVLASRWKALYLSCVVCFVQLI